MSIEYTGIKDLDLIIEDYKKQFEEFEIQEKYFEECLIETNLDNIEYEEYLMFFEEYN